MIAASRFRQRFSKDLSPVCYLPMEGDNEPQKTQQSPLYASLFRCVHGYGLARGAEQVVKTGPKWQPGEQNERKVRSYHNQPITFVIASF